MEGAPYTTPSLQLGPNGSVVKVGGGPSCHRAIVIVAKVVCCLPIYCIHATALHGMSCVMSSGSRINVVSGRNGIVLACRALLWASAP